MALLLFYACAHEELCPLPSTQDCIVATMNAPAATKTAMGEAEDGTSAVGILWTAEDKIGVFDASSSSQKCYMKTSDSGNKADAIFAVTGTTAFSSPTYAYYPYSADNDGRSITSLAGNLPQEQNMDSGKLYGDYKYGISEGSSAQGHKFVFSHLFSMARIEIDASNTPLAGQKLSSLTITVNRGSEKVNIAGDFTFSAISGEWEMGDNLQNSITLKWTDGPTLEAETLTCYASLFPTIAPGDIFTIEAVAGGYRAVFTATSRIRFSREHIYTFPVTLRKYESIKLYDPDGNEIDYESLLPVISSFSFSVSNNAAKILNNELKWNSTSHTPSFQTVNSLTATINDDTQEINLTIPYLYDFNLKPSFTVGNNNCVVTVNGVQQTSGQSEVDFSKPVTYTVTNTESKYSRDYVVKVTNSGIAVVVIEQSTSGSFKKEYEGGVDIFGSNIGGTLVNQFVNFMIRGKNTEWVDDDKITIYNADGNVDCSVTGGVRLRGNTSKVYPKKPFAIKFNDKKSVLGMPSHKRWVLLANWLDHSMIRNAVAFNIAQAIEYAWRNSGGAIGDGIPWNVHGQNVELIVDGHHVGNYLLCEQIKIDGNRLDIQDPYDIESPESDDYTQYGHLLEIDATYDEPSKFKTSKSVPFMFKDEVSSTILNSVKSKIQNIETNLYKGTEAGFAAAFEMLDINSVIDQMLIWELTMNREYGDPKSVYMFMNGDGKLCAGPVWDFDRGTFQNQEKATALCDNSGPEGSSGKTYRIKPDNEWMYWRTQWETASQSYIWYRQLVKNDTFVKTVQERWAVIKPYLDMIPGVIEQYGEDLATSYKYDSAMWPTSKADIRKYKSDFNDWSGDETLGAEGNYQEVIDNFIEVYKERLAGMDGLITSGTFTKN